jgi:hypothetical protein
MIFHANVNACPAYRHKTVTVNWENLIFTPTPTIS